MFWNSVKKFNPKYSFPSEWSQNPEPLVPNPIKLSIMPLLKRKEHKEPFNNLDHHLDFQTFRFFHLKKKQEFVVNIARPHNIVLIFHPNSPQLHKAQGLQNKKIHSTKKGHICFLCEQNAKRTTETQTNKLPKVRLHPTTTPKTKK